MSQSFRALGVSAPVVEVLAKRGIEAPFKIQILVLPDALAGLDILAKSPTGSGKTLGFGLPLIERASRESRPSALVLVPTRELALQVAGELEPLAAARGLTVAAVYGGAPLPAQAKRAKVAQLVIATPGRLQDLLDRRMISLDAVRSVVLDEADRMLDMGFKPQVEKIMRKLPRERQTMMFSATLAGEVEDLARTYTTAASRYSGELPIEMRQGEIDHTFVSVRADGKVDRLVQEIQGADGLTLVFGRFRAGAVRTLVATDVAARGIDLVDITHVINYDPPEDDTAYVHRIGRTGRAGRSGTGITFVLPEQQADVSRVANKLGHRDSFEREGMQTARPKVLYTSRRGRRSRW
jgi:ATP-dependent RNA helicase RhlE